MRAALHHSQYNREMASRLLHRAISLRPTTLKAIHAAALGSVDLSHGPQLAPRRHYAQVPLGGQSIFQTRAAAEVAQTQTEAPSSAANNGQGPQQQQQQHQNPYEGVVLPTSDESEELLRIRHSVSPLSATGYIMNCCNRECRHTPLPTLYPDLWHTCTSCC